MIANLATSKFWRKKKKKNPCVLELPNLQFVQLRQQAHETIHPFQSVCVCVFFLGWIFALWFGNWEVNPCNRTFLVSFCWFFPSKYRHCDAPRNWPKAWYPDILGSCGVHYINIFRHHHHSMIHLSELHHTTHHHVFQI